MCLAVALTAWRLHMPQPIEDLDDDGEIYDEDLDDKLLPTPQQPEFIGQVEINSTLPPSLGGDLTSDEKNALVQLVMKFTEPCRSPPLDNDAAPSLHAFTFSTDQQWMSVHGDPPIFTCDQFLSAADCEELITTGRPILSASATMSDDLSLVNVGAGGAVRSSSSAILPVEMNPACAALVSKICTLCGKSADHMERVQITRYTANEEYSEHFDSPAPSRDEQCLAFMAQGGQRVATCIIYLNDVERGGATAFPTIGYECTPRRGRCLLFCPGFADGRRDERLLHAARPATDEKWVAQVWVRAHADPRCSLTPKRWPRGCASFADLYALALTDGDPKRLLLYYFQRVSR